MATRRMAAASCLCIALLLLLLLEAVMSGSSTGVFERAREPQLEAADAGGYRTYIILVEPPPAARAEEMEDADAHRRAWHQSFLPSETTALGEPRLQFSYPTWFSARLTEEEFKQVSTKPGVFGSIPNYIGYLQTTTTGDNSGGQGMMPAEEISSATA